MHQYATETCSNMQKYANKYAKICKKDAKIYKSMFLHMVHLYALPTLLMARTAEARAPGTVSSHVPCPVTYVHCPRSMSESQVPMNVPCRLAAASAPSAVTRPMSSGPCQRSARLTASHETVRPVGAGRGCGPRPWALGRGQSQVPAGRSGAARCPATGSRHVREGRAGCARATRRPTTGARNPNRRPTPCYVF